ncbi:MAG: PH domain-containing protein [Actinomycetales bacterium]|nr:PH domain-containing protein [Actinomycetales bacterium]
MAQDLFSDLDIEWTPVSTGLIKGRRLAGSITFGILFLFVAAGAGFAIYLAPAPWGTLAAITVTLPILALWVWFWFWVPRNQASWGYFEGEKELLIKSGIMFRRLVVVPYGRMQFVDVESGPIASANGYASVTLNTASTETAADIPGVPTAEAHRLRDRLTELGDFDDSGV